MNQYAPSRGLPRLRLALASVYQGDFFPGPGRALNPDTEVMVTQGANQALCVIMQTFVNPGDRVLLIEPYFDIYKPAISLVGGVPISVPLRAPLRASSASTATVSANDWRLDMEALKETIVRERPRALLLNTPHNPTGKVFSQAELETLATLAQQHNLLVISDEVYDRIYYSSCPSRIASLPGMWERTLTVGSGGKSFGVTGWRIGWILGAERLVSATLAVQARSVFTTPTPLQSAVAVAFEATTDTHRDFFPRMRAEYRAKRDWLVAMLEDAGLACVIPDGGYFVMADSTRLLASGRIPKTTSSASLSEPVDYAVARWMTEHVGVTPIPPSPFYEPENAHIPANLLRFCFCKTDETLEEASRRFKRLSEPRCDATD